MDVLSHGLWGGAAFGRKNRRAFLVAFACGVAPDLLSFGIFTFGTLIGVHTRPDWSAGPPSEALIPAYVDTLYNVTHSLVPVTAVFLLVWVIRKKPFLPLLAWPLHILMDIPTHTTAFFSTPFLWPFAHPHVNGIPWSHPFIFFPNWITIIVVYILWWRQDRAQAKK